MTNARYLLASASIGTLLFAASAAHAQTSTTAPAADTAESEIVVTGIRGSLREAIDAKRDLSVIADVVTAEDVGKFPDKNVAEALQRVPGIVVNREFGEGERVSLRGTAPNLTKTLLNGHSVATADWFILDQVASTRSFNYLTLPAEIIGRLEVYKSPQADVEEGGVGGTINVITRNPLDLDPLTLSASAQAAYSDLSGKVDPQVSGLISWKNADETFGVLVGAIYQKRRTRRDGLEIFGYRSFPVGGGQSALVPTLIGSTMFEQDRERYGANIGIQFRPSDELEINITGLYSRFNADNFNQNYIAWGEQALAGGGTISNAVVRDGVAVSGNIASATGGTTGFGVVYDAIDRQAVAKTVSADFDLTYRPTDSLSVHFKAGWTKANGDTNNENFIEFAGPGAFSYDLTSGRPEVSFSNPNPLNPAGIRPDFARIQSVTNDDEEKYVYLDVEKEVEWGPLTALKFGVKYTDHDRVAERFATNGGVFTPGLRCNGAPCTSADFATGSGMPGDFLDNIASPGTLTDYWRVDPAKLRAIYGASTSPSNDRFLVPGNTYSINEKAWGGYGLAKFGGEGWRGNVGVRVITTDQTSDGYIIGGANPEFTNPFGGFTPSTAKRSYTDILPSANLSVDLSPQVVLRFAAGKTVTRPDFVDITPGVDLNGTLLTGRGGDPNLDPYRANQYDLSIEWYPDRETIVALAAFYKDIQSYIVNTTSTEVLPGVFVPGSQPAGCVAAGGGNPNLFNCPYQINRRSNGDGGRNQGFEFQVSRPIWGGFGAVVNYTYSDAKANNGDPIPGNSKHSLNLTGYYENDLVSARLSYNYRSKFFIDIDRAAPLNQAALSSLDASVSVNITDNIALTADAINLTNEKIEQYSGTRDRPRAIYDNGRQFYVGARLKF
ncbi:iron complex outermembrane receptor protein [Sphingopyxis sp. OAS728]|uniref:TonB-dependent receptor n=1 Tax=Sphingopyxis sp. OAS728 TaxID=2663823 RepID=UPI00178991F8|nr:TonB-dependent receptor [Sphingopyxis sp. OAS728]MBE1527840.1 iron complex outermembrane receptor protein [Sphingopyxis sp. OAS728]